MNTIEPSIDPIVLQIVEGTLASVEAEVEAAIERTSRSPMIREARDFRAGIHDRHCRKLTGRSYSALVQPIVRDFPLETMRPGDVFFHNDVYGSEGGIGHLPDLCVTVPVFADGIVVAFVQAFGHHDDIGGAVPGSMPSHATSAYQEGLIVPPVRIYRAGAPNEDLIKVMVRNSRLPDSLRGDLDSEVAACRMGAERLGELFRRYGRAQVETCFDAILERTTETFRRELLAKIPDGTYVWEDYAEHDGVDPPRLHRQRMTLTKRDDRLIIDFTGTSAQAKGPINHAGDYADGVFLKKHERMERCETTGGGGWGDPLEREPELVALDALQRKVSLRAAREAYGVVLVGPDSEPSVDVAATRTLRDRLRAAHGRQPFFDRGPGYRALAGVDHAEVDFVDTPSPSADTRQADRNRA